MRLYLLPVVLLGSVIFSGAILRSDDAVVLRRIRHGDDWIGLETRSPTGPDTQIKDIVPGMQWQIKGLRRLPMGHATNTIATTLTTWWHCIILNLSTNEQTLCDVLTKGLDPVGSFYGERCGREPYDESWPFKLSLGYNEESDSAVLTVCFTPNGTAAWFGYEHVSRQNVLGDSRPEPVVLTGCA
ncbi:hypothetical protein VTJ49DRAFT_1396 [Mycothermus thermophilus]|uniref:Uncharacterized protein n=1 Tax=Humicola insolens TaxID=85995 RepID=A0ABR3VD64_HUMIN